MPRGMTAIGYMDDTLIMSEWDSVNTIQERANATLEVIVNHI